MPGITPLSRDEVEVLSELSIVQEYLYECTHGMHDEPLKEEI
jgi:hypothetical protein